MSTFATRSAARWILPVAVIAAAALVAGLYWLNNRYSGWDEIAAVHPADDTVATRPAAPRRLTVVQPSGRSHTFVSRRGYAFAEVGFDRSGFWVRARDSGWLGGPAKPIFVAWNRVERCQGPRIGLKQPPFELIVDDPQLLDVCRGKPAAATR